jgi:hypothetical protein
LTKEHFTYQWENFVADFGGYLGLLLGASLLDIYDLTFNGIYKYMEISKKINEAIKTA